MTKEIINLFQVDLSDVWFRFEGGAYWSGSIMANPHEFLALSLDWFYRDCIPKETICTNVKAVIQVIVPVRKPGKKLRVKGLRQSLYVALNVASTIGHEICHYVDLIEGREQSESTAYAWESYFMDNWPDFELDFAWALAKEMRRTNWLGLNKGDMK